VAHTDIDFAAEGLLDGLEGKAREEREELLQWLVDEHDAPLEELKRTNANGILLLIPAGRVLDGGRPASLSERDIAEKSGLDLETLIELRRAQGFPAISEEELDIPMFGQTDLASACNAKDYLDAGLSRDQLISTARVLGRGLAQTANQMRQLVFEMSMRPGATERELAEAYAAVAEGLMPMLGPMLEQLLRLHLRQTLRAEMVTAAERERGELPGARPVYVGFADLVGFTRLGEQLPPAELDQVAARLDVLANEAVEPGARVIKTLGDAVMFVSEEPGPMLASAFGLLAAAEAEGENYPPLRVGIAHGAALLRAGDWFGHPVNLASRVTAAARPSSVLVTSDVHEALKESPEYTWSFAGARHLKGVQGETKLYRARPAERDNG